MTTLAKRTIHCGICGKPGHNRKKCGSLDLVMYTADGYVRSRSATVEEGARLLEGLDDLRRKEEKLAEQHAIMVTRIGVMRNRVFARLAELKRQEESQ